MQKIKTWQQALDYIYAKLPMYHRQGASAYKKDLTNTIKLCAACGNPQNDLKTIHIAGTNGKGTTTHIIAGGLQAQGFSTGVYTSPHYIDFRERIKINGIYIDRKYIINFINTYITEIEEIQPSFFEVTVAMAFRYFADMKVDYAVIETGLGGRLDSTNVITPLISVITNISFDHQSMLGNTLIAIAGEKAGIIKKHVPVVIGEVQTEIDEVFKAKANFMDAPISFAEHHTSLQVIDEHPKHTNYNIFFDKSLWIEGLSTDLTGPFQEKNIITSLYALRVLSKKNSIDFVKIRNFFPDLKAKTAYIGRWQILGNAPMIIADSAHNEAGIKIVVEALANISYNKLHFIAGFVNDKDITPILSLFPKEAIYYFAKANIPRGLHVNELLQAAQESGLSGKSYTSVRKAFSAARTKAQPGDLIFIGGSIFIVAEVLADFYKSKKNL